MALTEFSIIYKRGNKNKEFRTNNREILSRKAILLNGTIYIDVRYKAKKRLQRKYFRLQQQNKLPIEIDYPTLIK
jgi:hypothetical protein